MNRIFFKKRIQFCRVCGFLHDKDYKDNDYFPWGKDGNTPTFDFCECCGTEFGYNDYCLENIIFLEKSG